MGSKKAILILGLLAMVLFLISSEVAARDLAEANEVGDAKYGGGGYGGGYPGRGGHGGGYPGRGGHGGGGYPGHGGYGGGHPGRGGYGGGGHCRYGCCGGGYHGGCRCCSYAGEAVAVETQDKTRN